VTSRMPACVHSLADATRKPNENADAVILHYQAINAELKAQLAVACAQRDALRQLVEHCLWLIDAERGLVRAVAMRAPAGHLPVNHAY
jgi:hypothetical protein